MALSNPGLTAVITGSEGMPEDNRCSGIHKTIISLSIKIVVKNNYNDYNWDPQAVQERSDRHIIYIFFSG